MVYLPLLAPTPYLLYCSNDLRQKFGIYYPYAGETLWNIHQLYEWINCGIAVSWIIV